MTPSIGVAQRVTGESAFNFDLNRHLLMAIYDGGVANVSTVLRAAADGDLKVTLDGETVAVSVGSLPLPAGAATEATLALLEGKDFATEATATSILAALAGLATASNQLPDGHNVTVAGVATQATLADILTELLLKAKLTDKQPVNLNDGAGTSLNSTLNALHVSIQNIPSVSARVSDSGGAGIGSDTSNGQVGLNVNQIGKKLLSGFLDINGAGTFTNLIGAPGAGNKIKLYGLHGHSRDPVGHLVQFRFGAGATFGYLTIPLSHDATNGLGSSGNFHLNYFPAYKLGGDNQALQVDVIGTPPAANQAIIVADYEIVT